MVPDLPDPAAELVLDVGADDLGDVGIRLEAHGARPPRVEPRRPAGDDLLDPRVRLPLDAARHLGARDLLERVD